MNNVFNKTVGWKYSPKVQKHNAETECIPTQILDKTTSTKYYYHFRNKALNFSIHSQNVFMKSTFLLRCAIFSIT